MTTHSGSSRRYCSYRRVATRSPSVLYASTFAQQSAAVSASGNAYWRYTLAIARSPLDAGQIDFMTDRHDRPVEKFGDTERQSLGKN